MRMEEGRGRGESDSTRRAPHAVSLHVPLRASERGEPAPVAIERFLGGSPLGCPRAIPGASERYQQHPETGTEWSALDAPPRCSRGR
eukprot:4488472-Pyramimonas_sp.AAC.1